MNNKILAGEHEKMLFSDDVLMELSKKSFEIRARLGIKNLKNNLSSYINKFVE